VHGPNWVMQHAPWMQCAIDAPALQQLAEVALHGDPTGTHAPQTPLVQALEQQFLAKEHGVPSRSQHPAATKTDRVRTQKGFMIPPPS